MFQLAAQRTQWHPERGTTPRLHLLAGISLSRKEFTWKVFGGERLRRCGGVEKYGSGPEEESEKRWKGSAADLGVKICGEELERYFTERIYGTGASSWQGAKADRCSREVPVSQEAGSGNTTQAGSWPVQAGNQTTDDFSRVSV